jgi:hypothetical protein
MLELAIDERKARARVLEDVRDLVRGETGVDRHENPASGRNSEMSFEERRDVRREERDAIAPLHAPGLQSGRETSRSLGELAVGVPPLSVDDGRALGKHSSASPQEVDRGQLTAIDRSLRVRGPRHGGRRSRA